MMTWRRTDEKQLPEPMTHQFIEGQASMCSMSPCSLWHEKDRVSWIAQQKVDENINIILCYFPKVTNCKYFVDYMIICSISKYCSDFFSCPLEFNFTAYIQGMCSHRCTVAENKIIHSHGSFLYAPSQWETTLQCNVVSHWLSACIIWSLHFLTTIQHIILTMSSETTKALLTTSYVYG